MKFFSSPVGALSENIATPSGRAYHAADAAADEEATQVLPRYRYDRTTGRPATGADQGKMPSSIVCFLCWF